MSTFLTQSRFASPRENVVDVKCYEEVKEFRTKIIDDLKERKAKRYVGLQNFKENRCDLNAIFTALMGIDQLHTFEDYIEKRFNNYRATVLSDTELHKREYAKYMESVKRNLTDYNEELFVEEDKERYSMAMDVINHIGPHALQTDLYDEVHKGQLPWLISGIIKKLVGPENFLVIAAEGFEMDLCRPERDESFSVFMLPGEVSKKRQIQLYTSIMPKEIDSIKEKYVMVSRNTPLTKSGTPPEQMSMPLSIKGVNKELHLRSMIIPTCRLKLHMLHLAGGFIKDGMVTFVDDLYNFVFPIHGNEDLVEQLIRHSTTLIYECCDANVSDSVSA